MTGQSNKNKKGRKLECGAGTEISCTDLFRRRYYEKHDSSHKKRSFGKIRLLVFQIIKSKYFEFHEAFDGWSRDEYGNFDEKFINNQVEGFYELIFQIIKKREEEDKDFKIDNIDGWVRRVVKNFIYDETKMHRQVRDRLVPNRMVEDLRVLLRKPDLTIEKLSSLAKKALSNEEEKLMNDINKIPGYRNVWFKIKTYKKEPRLYFCETYQDRIDKLDFLTITRRDLGSRRIITNSNYDSTKLNDF
jgi:hypothetical protein